MKTDNKEFEAFWETENAKLGGISVQVRNAIKEIAFSAWKAARAESNRDAERYRVLRMYEIYSMGWPFRKISAPAGLIAASCRSGEHAVMTQATLDRTLDDMLGLIPSADKSVRADYQEWRARETRDRIAAAEKLPSDEYTYEVNNCTCHPETCGCNPYKIVDREGTKITTVYTEAQAREVVKRLNK